MTEGTDRVAERFWAKVDQSDGCWRWRGTINRTGYGYFKLAGKTRLAHRVAYELTKGSIPAGVQVDHVCHNRDVSCRGGWGCPHRGCVNPEHLELVTQSENLQRSSRCGERVRERAAAITHCPRGHEYDAVGFYLQNKTRRCKACHADRMRARSMKAQGVRDPRRIPDESVERVRAFLAQGQTHAQIAAETGVSMATISRIRTGGSWFAPE